MNEYQEWREGVRQMTFPKWDELPKLDLYMDQVVEYVNGILAPLHMTKITPAMINNYVKQHVLLAPVKKKYQTMQIADILIISMMKPIFSLEEIRSSIDQITVDDYPKNAYNTFVDALLARFAGPVTEEFNESNLALQLMRDSANIIYNKMEAEQLLEVMSRRSPKKDTPLIK
ncbi:MAG: DUF1836 domain-containing protein [Lactobacillaceae bacterium]|jgi:hypothetical protein|nr:DUF1836 domain-containing protein [Lactobacillaceae bacterium]